MLYCESGNHWAFLVNKGSFPQNSFRDVVNGIYSILSTRQVLKVAKQEVKVDHLIQELVEPACEINQNYLEEDLIHDDTYYFEMAAFEFQGIDFLVPTNQLVQKPNSIDFHEVFGPTFGTTKTPNTCPGVSADDFRGLMRYLYPLDPNDWDELTVDDWIAILRLSTKWKMFNLREEAIQKLKKNSHKLSDIMKVQLGKECKIAEWVRSGYVSLVERDEHFTVADVIAIGLDDVIKLCELREQDNAGEWDIYCNHLTLEVHGPANLIANSIPQITSVNRLDHDDDDLVAAILDAQSRGSRRLMLDAWERMARRPESLTKDEVERLTLGTALRMWEVRFEMRWAAWSIVQKYEPKCDIENLDISECITSAFASELVDIEAQASNYALFKNNDEEEIPDSALEPMPSENSRTLFEQSLALRRRIVDLEQMLKENTDTMSGRQLRQDLRRCRLSAHKWCTLATGSTTPASTLNLEPIGAITIVATLEDITTKLILKNAAKLSLDGSGVVLGKWKLRKSRILDFATRYRIETQSREGSQVIDLILPVSES